MEVEIEEECLHTLALYNPVANDLRFVVSVLKINGDLERIADKAVNIAEQVSGLIESPLVDTLPFDFLGQSERVRSMLKKSLDALVHADAELADWVRRTDDQVDKVHREMGRSVKQAIREHPDQVDGLLTLWSLSRQLERIADHAVNIAEDVIYMVKGDILRHVHEGPGDSASPGNESAPAPITRMSLLSLSAGRSKLAKRDFLQYDRCFLGADHNQRARLNGTQDIKSQGVARRGGRR